MSSRDVRSLLRDAAPAILPSLLLCDFGNLEREVRRLEEAGAAALHLDVMDGVFVPNLTYGMPIVAAVRRLTQLPLDVHLMISQPQKYVAAFREAGADVLSFHVEAVEEPRKLLEDIRRLGALAGITLNPATPLSRLDSCWDACDLVLVMSVEAGFGGQTFHPSALEKLHAARKIGGSDLLLEIDGGVNSDTIGPCAAAGADLFVVGSGILRQPDYGQAISDLHSRAQSGARSSPG